MTKMSIEELLSHALYKRSQKALKEVTEAQILKGYEKYLKPLNSSEWSGKQLIRHAREELVDLGHYIAALEEKNEQLEEENLILEGKLDSRAIVIDSPLTRRVLMAVKNERLRQYSMFGNQRHDMGTWLKILIEEVGEVATAMQGGEKWTKTKDSDDLHTELIQVAAVAVAIAEQVKESGVSGEKES